MKHFAWSLLFLLVAPLAHGHPEALAPELAGKSFKTTSEKSLQYWVSTPIAASPDTVWALLAERTQGAKVSTSVPNQQLTWAHETDRLPGVRQVNLAQRNDGGTDLTFTETYSGSKGTKLEKKLPDLGPAVEAFTKDLKDGAERRAAYAFVHGVDGELRKRFTARDLAAWTHDTNITDANADALAKQDEQLMAYLTTSIKAAQRFDAVDGLDADTRRQLDLLKTYATLPGPEDDAKRAELARLSADLAGMYGKGKYCKTVKKKEVCRDLEQLEDVLATSRNYDEQLDAWQGWHSVAPPMRPMYQRFVELGNEGATTIGYADMGAGWRSTYDMPADEVPNVVDHLYEQVKPLYEQLHCYVRAELSEKYGADKVPLDGPIPAHLLGNMWAQDWSNLYPLVEPYPGQPSLDVTAALVAQKYDAKKMVRTAEGFFTSLGLDPLPESFWERSMLEKPADREVVCHASAWDPTYSNDLRIKMCIQPSMEDLVTIHHELGHDYYYHYYYMLPMLYQSGANDGFHEGIGDTLVLSITPGYLKQIGLLSEVSDSKEALINKQMMDALDGIAFLPFGRMIDQWRWDVFSGAIPPEKYNEGWWKLREQYQGVEAPVPRTEADFDPGAKYHIPGNTPYLRYFLARILQYQFHRSLCEAAGHEGPLHTCSIYGSKDAGEKLKAMLALGASKPWPDALEALTGSREMDASAIISYYDPLMGWLKEQNEGRTCGW